MQDKIIALYRIITHYLYVSPDGETRGSTYKVIKIGSHNSSGASMLSISSSDSASRAAFTCHQLFKLRPPLPLNLRAPADEGGESNMVVFPLSSR